MYFCRIGRILTPKIYPLCKNDGATNAYGVKPKPFNRIWSVVVHPLSSSTFDESKINTGTRSNWTNTYHFNDGLWFYRISCPYQDWSPAPQLMFIRRRIRNKPTFTFRLDPKIPLEEPVIDKKLDVFDSGDSVNHLDPVDLSKPLPDFENSDELKTANEDVKRLFSLAMGRRKDIVEYQIREVLKNVQRHQLDDSSPEVYVAKKTMKIRSLQEILRQTPYNKWIKHVLALLIDKRNKKLRILRMQDMRRFEWLVKTLGITYRPTPLGTIVRKPQRVDELSRLTEEYCNKIKYERMEAHHQKLKVQQEEFLKEKEKTLKWIEEQEQKFGLSSNKLGKSGFM